MQRKQALENEIRKILNEKPSDKRKNDAILILKEISQTTILTAQEKKDLLNTKENIAERTSLFRFMDSTINMYFFNLLLKLGHNTAHESINLIIHLNKELSKKTKLTIDCINILISQNHFDLIYRALINHLIRPEECSQIATVADHLAKHVLQMGHADKWQAFDYALCQQDHPLHLVLKGSKALESLQKAFRDNDTPAPSYVPSPPSSSPGYFAQPRLYPSLDGAVEVIGYRKN